MPFLKPFICTEHRGVIRDYGNCTDCNDKNANSSCENVTLMRKVLSPVYGTESLCEFVCCKPRSTLGRKLGLKSKNCFKILFV